MLKLAWPNDPVVEEVRRIRSELWKEAGGTVSGLQKLLDQATPRRRRSPKKRKPKDK
jgi:hypothetical protein